MTHKASLRSPQFMLVFLSSPLSLWDVLPLQRKQSTLLSIHCRECIAGTIVQRRPGNLLRTSQQGSGDKADRVVAACQETFYEYRMWEELFVLDGLLVCRPPCTMETQKSMCFIVLSLYARWSWGFIRLLIRANKVNHCCEMAVLARGELIINTPPHLWQH